MVIFHEVILDYVFLNAIYYMIVYPYKWESLTKNAADNFILYISRKLVKSSLFLHSIVP